MDDLPGAKEISQPEQSQKKGLNTWLVMTVIVVVVIGLAFFLLSSLDQSTSEETEDSLESSTTRNTLPEITPTTNPAERLPETNPAKKANPFSETYKNPFE
jgi:heme/copper-type cytochrome/quinol oxidase subunit 2